MRISPLALLLTSVLAVPSWLQAVEVGEKAPSLTSAAWVKGGPAEIGKGLVLVEFWATWCPPCRVTIPNLTKLAKKYAGKLTVVGLSDEEEEVVKPFVTGQGDAMDYHVGVAEEGLHQAYMDGHVGIPFAFLVGADGVVLWAGHVQGLEQVVAAVIDGTFDAKAEAAHAKRRQELQDMLQEDPGADQKALLARISAKALALLHEDPSDEEAFKVAMGVAKHGHDHAGVRAVLSSLPLAQLAGTQAAEIALLVADDPEVADRNLDLAWALAERAVAAAPDEAIAHAAAAHVRYALGLLEEAIVAQEQATKLDPGLGADLLFFREAMRLRDLAKAGKPLTPPATLPAPKPLPEIKTMAPPSGGAGNVP